MKKKSTRRSFVKSAAAVGGGLCSPRSSRGVEILPPTGKESDARIERIVCSYEEHVLRAPLKFARTVVNRATLLTVNCTVHTRAGRVASGFGTMPLNYTFSFPSGTLSEQARLAAMKALAAEIATITGAYEGFGHPIDINWELAPLYLKAAADVSRRLQLADPIPKLCTLVTAAAFDAAIHDAYGKAQGLNCFHTYGPEFMRCSQSPTGAVKWPHGSSRIGAYYRQAPQGRRPAESQSWLPD